MFAGITCDFVVLPLQLLEMSFNCLEDVESTIPVSPLHLAVSTAGLAPGLQRALGSGLGFTRCPGEVPAPWQRGLSLGICQSCTGRRRKGGSSLGLAFPKGQG